MFGGNNNKPFGSGGFGTAATGGGLFGGPAATTGFGANPAAGNAFGQQKTSLFGQTAAAPTTGFGGGTAAGGLFGGTSAAGGGLFATTTPQQATGGGLFGSTAAAGSSFLKPAASAFGAGSSGGFGTGSSLFGGTTQPTASTGGGLFGQPTQATSSTGGGLFGSGTTGGLFGTTAATAAATATGTTSVKFAPTDGTDTVMKSGQSQTVKTRHYCITGMKEYEGKSIEELRYEDYAAGVKGPQAGGVKPAGGLFGGQTQQAGFGATPSSSGLFGGTATTSTTGFGGFGTAATTSAFGQPKAGGLFGQPAAATTGGLFGQTASTAATGFGTATSTQAGGLFGSTAAKPAFGASTGFGQPATSAFGQPAASTGFGAFGAKPTTGFGATSTATTGFGAASTGFGSTGGMFGKPGFGAPAATTGLTGFGTTAGTGLTLGANTGGLFNKPATGGLFSTTAGGFGAPAATTGFGAAATVQPQQQPQSLITTNQDLVAQNELIKQQLFNLTNSPYGDSPLFRKTNSKDPIPTDPKAQAALLSDSGGKTTPKITSRPLSKVRLQSVQAIGTSPSAKGDLFEGLGDDSYSGGTPGSARRSVKKLVIRSSPAVGGSTSRHTSSHHQTSAFSSPSLYSNGRLRSVPDATVSMPGQPIGNEDTFNLSAAPPAPADRRQVNKVYPQLELDDTIDQLQGGAASQTRTIQPSKHSPQDRKPVITQQQQRSDIGGASPLYLSTAPPTAALADVTHSVHKQEIMDSTQDETIASVPPHPCGVICTRTDYYTIPSLDDLAQYLDGNGDCMVDNLSIGREGYGSVFFPGSTNVAHLDIDSTVHFRRKEVTIYPDDDNKPAEGEGLNKRAEVTLDCVWPKDKSNNSPIKSPQRLKVMNYQDKIEIATAKIGATFIDYRPDTGSWVFEVKHFSKYGLLDDSDDDNADSQQDVKKLKALHISNSNVQRLAIQQKLTPLAAQQKAAGDDVSTVSVGAAAAGVASRTFVLGDGQGRGGTASVPTNYLGLRDEDSGDDEQENRPLGALHSTRKISQDDDLGDDDSMNIDLLPTSHRLAAQCGVAPTNVQRMKASFLDDDEDELTFGLSPKVRGSQSAQVAAYRLGGTMSPMPQSPLIRSTLRAGAGSPLTTGDKLGFTSKLMQQKTEMLGDYEDKKIGSLLKPQRVSAAADVSLPEPEYPLLPSGVERPLRPRTRIQGHRLQLTKIPLDKSLVNGKQRNFLDSAALAGRRSRVSWGPNLTIAHTNGKSIFSKEERKTRLGSTSFSILSPGRSRLTTPYQVTVETANLGSQGHQTDPLVLETRIKALKIQLKNCVPTNSDNSSCHRLEPAPGLVALHEYGKESLNDLDAAVSSQSDASIEAMFRHNVLVWELLVALWGSLPEFENVDDLDMDSYLYQKARNEAFSRWLTYAANHKVEEETSMKAKQINGVCSAIFSYLSARQIPEATRLAMESRDYRLALLLSQGATSQSVKNMIHKQLSDWNATRADEFISSDRLKLYVLLAGNMVWENSSGLINCCLDMDWKRALALHYWYSQSKFNIQSALARYDAAWQESEGCEAYAAPPLPLYMESTGVNDLDIRDTCYHLLKLYCNPLYSLQQLLSSASHTADPLDYHTSWHLLQVLIALGYTHLSDWQVAAIHTRYSEQLESCGLWHWAILPLLNLKSAHAREKSIKDLLLRHIRVGPGMSSDGDAVYDMNSGTSIDSQAAGDGESEYTGREKFILTELNVPAKWLHQTKAMKAKYEGLYEEEAWHLLHSQQLNPAHRILLEKIAPEYIIADNLDGLHAFLDILNQGSDSVSEWIIGGKIYLDYITLHDVVIDIKQQLESSGSQKPRLSYSVERLRPELLSLGRRLLSLATPKPLHMLAQSTMALHTAHNIKFILSLEEERCIPDTNIPSARFMVEPLSLLPLQSDDSVNFLRDTMSAFMLEY